MQKLQVVEMTPRYEGCVLRVRFAGVSRPIYKLLSPAKWIFAQAGTRPPAIEEGPTGALDVWRIIPSDTVNKVLSFVGERLTLPVTTGCCIWLQERKSTESKFFVYWLAKCPAYGIQYRFIPTPRIVLV